MTLATLLPLVLKASIAGTVLAVGMRTRREDVLSLFRDPDNLARSFLSMLVLMPMLALAMAAALPLHPAVEVALVGLAVSPVPPLLPGKELKAGGRASYVVGLLFATALVSIVTVPLAVHLVGGLSGAPRSLAAGRIAGVVLASVVVPLLLGVAVRALAPALAERAARPVVLVSTVLLAAGFLPLLPTLWRPMLALVGNGTLLAIAAFAGAGLATGHLLGGREREDRVVLALSTAARHPMVAIAAATALFPGHREVAPAVLLYLLVSGLVSAVYLRRTTPAPVRHAPPPRPRVRVSELSSLDGGRGSSPA
ncbi:MAG TPA: hypothetical protein VEQ60_02710 [Longimicrobium sp.]|nr:hypothetical protein [Longimicrobium sp.]